jgi:ABC-type sugar transport system permease subunit
MKQHEDKLESTVHALMNTVVWIVIGVALAIVVILLCVAIAHSQATTP